MEEKDPEPEMKMKDRDFLMKSLTKIRLQEVLEVKSGVTDKIIAMGGSAQIGAGGDAHSMVWEPWSQIQHQLHHWMSLLFKQVSM